jgi:hypothetical protein
MAELVFSQGFPHEITCRKGKDATMHDKHPKTSHRYYAA